MKQTRGRLLLLSLLLMAALSLGLLGCGEKGGGEAQITLSGTLPETGIMGKTVALPSATATDRDGSDISDAVLVYVTGVDGSGNDAVYPVYGLQANRSHTFVPKTYYTWKISYQVYDSEETLISRDFTYTVTDDDTVPELKLSSATPISATAGSEFLIPSAEATDDGEDISELIQVTLYRDETYLNKFATKGREYPLTLPSGAYTVKYSVADGAGNAPDAVSIPVTVARYPYGEEWLSASGWTNGVGGVWTEEGQLQVGVTSGSANKVESEAALNVDRVGLDDYVTVLFSVDDMHTEGGEWLYHFGYYGSKNRDGLAPTGMEGSWPDGFFLRGDKNNLVLRYSGDDKYPKMAMTFPYFDGKTHALTMRVTAEGTAADAEGAAVVAEVWLDVSPLETAAHRLNVNYAKITLRRGDSSGNDGGSGGNLEAEAFDELWTGADGWLYFGSMCDTSLGLAPADDRMLIKSVKVFAPGHTDFTFGIPVFTMAGEEPRSTYELNQPIEIPTGSWTGAETEEVYLLSPDGSKIDLTDQSAYTFTKEGLYKLVYRGVSEAGVDNLAAYSFYAVEDIANYEVPMPQSVAQPVSVVNASKDSLKSAQYDLLTAFEDSQKVFNGSGNGSMNYLRWTSVLGEQGNLAKMDFGIFGLQLTGANKLNTWLDGSGFTLTYQLGTLMIGYSGKQFDTAICTAALADESWVRQGADGKYVLDISLAYSIEYVQGSQGGMKGIRFRVWAGKSLQNLYPVAFKYHSLSKLVTRAQCAEILTDPYVPYLSAVMLNELGISQLGCDQSAGVYAAWVQQNGGGSIGFSEAQILSEIPEPLPPSDRETMTIQSGVANASMSGIKSAQHDGLAAFESTQKVFTGSGDGKINVLKFSSTAKMGVVGLQLTGNAALDTWFHTSSDGAGLTLTTYDGTYLSLGYNGHCIDTDKSIGLCWSALPAPAADGSQEFWVAYRLTYTFEENGAFAGIAVEVWMGSDLGTMTKCSFQSWASALTKEQSDLALADPTKPFLSAETAAALGWSKASLSQEAGVYAAWIQGGNAEATLSYAEAQVLDAFPEQA